MKKKIYLANPYGFSTQMKTLLQPVTEILESLGLEVWEPFSGNTDIDYTKKGWAYDIAQRDLVEVKNCDAIFAIVNGLPPEEGVMIELGIAIALNKKIFLFRDDFRKCSEGDEYPLNLMLFSGLPKEGWQDYYYTSLDEIGAPHKALAKWAAE